MVKASILEKDGSRRAGTGLGFGIWDIHEKGAVEKLNAIASREP
jgi:hypothetical protein